MDYITPQLIGMAPPKLIISQDADNDNKSLSNSTTTQQSRNKKREKGNDPGELSTYLEKRHAKRYLLFNVSDEHVDDRTLLLLGRQVVHLPWGSPRLPHPSDSMNGTHDYGGTPGELLSTPLTNTSAAGGGNKSSGTPAVSRVMDICYALHAYLSIPPCYELPLESSSPATATAATSTSTAKQRKGNSSSSNKESTKTSNTVACIYCSNGKTRTGVIVACYLRFCNEVPTSLKGFEIFCERRGIMSSSSTTNNTEESNNNQDISSHIPPSLRQFFINFDLLIHNKQYPYPYSPQEQQLVLSSIQLYGVPVDDMPCIDIWEHGGDDVRRLVYASHNHNTTTDDDNMNDNNVWDDEEGSYNHLNLPLTNDFTLICRFGGQFANDINDPSKVLFRYVNCPNFLKEGLLELSMVDVDMMRRYADSFDEDEFMLSLTFETVNNEEEDGSCSSSSPRKKQYQRRRTTSQSSMGGYGSLAAKFNGTIQPDVKDVILQGWRVLSDAHLSYLSSSVVQSGLHELSKEVVVGKSTNMIISQQSAVAAVGQQQQHDVDFRYIALQFTNGDVELAKVELTNGLFKSLLLDTAAQRQQQQKQEKPDLEGESLLEQPPILDNDVPKQPQQPVLKNDVEEGEDEEEEQSSVPLRASLSTAGSTEYDQSCGPYDDDEEDNDTALEADQTSTVPSVSHLHEEKKEGSNAVVDVEDESSLEAKVYHPESESVQLDDVESESMEAKGNSSHPQEEDEMPIKSTKSIVPEGANNEEVVTTEASQNINNDELTNDTQTEIASETTSFACQVVDNGEKSNKVLGESRDEKASTPDIDTSSDEDGPTANTPFADQSRSSLLEAIQMRGLKHSISNRPVGGNDNRSSLLMEIRNKASNKEGLTSHSPSSHVDEDATTGDDNSENVDPADTGLTLTVDMDLEHIVGLERAFSNSTSSDAGVMLIGLDQSVSTRNTRNDYEKDSTLSIASGNSSEQVDATNVDAPVVPSETSDTTNVETIIDDVNVDTAADEREAGSSQEDGASQCVFESTRAIEADKVSLKKEEVPLNKDPVYEKYYRMLKIVRILCKMLLLFFVLEYTDVDNIALLTS